MSARSDPIAGDPPDDPVDRPERSIGWRWLPAIVGLAVLLALGAAAPAGAQEDEGGTPTEEATEPAEEQEPTVEAQAEEDDAETFTFEVIEDLNLRAEPSADADVVTVMPTGATVQVAADAEPENDYLPVTFEDEEGWAFVAYLVEEGTDNAATVLDELNLRSEPSLDGEVLLVMPTGATLRIFGSTEDEDGEIWNRVVYDNTVGWAFAAFIGEPGDEPSDGGGDGDDPGTPDQAAVTTDDLNLRAGPSLDDEVLTVMPVGAEILVGSDVVDGFVPTTYEGQTGWAAAEFVAMADEDGDDSGDDGGDAEGEERITLSDLNLRAGPSTDESVLLVIPAGESLTLTAEGAENGFVTVVYQGTAGWVAAEFIARPDELAAEDETDDGETDEGDTDADETGDTSDYSDGLTGQSRVTLADVNLRDGPSTDGAVLLVIPAGETVTLTGDGVENDFVTVEFDGQTGWVAAEFLGE